MGGFAPSESFRLIALDRVDSTNEEVKRRALAGDPGGLVIWAREQTAGRGRHDRTWSSPAGNLYLSFLLRPNCTVAEGPQIGFVAGLSVASIVQSLLHNDEHVTCKWPNDVLVDGRKIAGILLESAAGKDGRIDWIALGIGLNVAWHPDDITGAYPATSLAERGATSFDLGAIADRLSRSVNAGLAVWRREGFATVRNRWQEIAFGRNQRVSVRLGNETVSGVFAGLDAMGAMILTQENGESRTIHAGDVFPSGFAIT
ncbi:MAG: biotin--[acetyl-CoA-carboxylase] ligase [Rhodospirillales bacterium]|nr:biotin--[acetyl-CoA-carboxylase] ligase [Rhodospirillales bacterium]